jgi:hypothetical protein
MCTLLSANLPPAKDQKLLCYQTKPKSGAFAAELQCCSGSPGFVSGALGIFTQG